MLLLNNHIFSFNQLKISLSLIIIFGGIFHSSAQTVEQETSLKSIESKVKASHSDIQQGRVGLEFYPIEMHLDDETLRLSDKKAQYPVNKVERLQPLFELGDPFLAPGPIKAGIKTPFKQMLQPSFLMFGSLRSALQSYDNGTNSTEEWSNRLDLHGNLTLSGTERLLFSIRPLDSESGDYTGYNFNPDVNDDWQNEFNHRVEQVFFEGEFAEIFPQLDPTDTKPWDVGFALGRQSITVQDGILINDIVDSVGITQNSLVFDGIPNLRITGIYAWNKVNYNLNSDDHSAKLFALLSQADTGWDSTIEFDIVFVNAKASSNTWFIGLSSTQRIAMFNTTFRLNSSIPTNDNINLQGKGSLLTAEISTTITGTDNILYLNSFWSIDDFRSAARSLDAGNPLETMGILFASVGMGRYGVPLGQPISDTVGMALGYQIFTNGIGSQLIFELGIRNSTDSNRDEGVIGIGARHEQAIGKQTLLRLDLFAAKQEAESSSQGVRVEWLLKF